MQRPKLSYFVTAFVGWQMRGLEFRHRTRQRVLLSCYFPNITCRCRIKAMGWEGDRFVVHVR